MPDFFDMIDSIGRDRHYAFYDDDVLRCRLDVDLALIENIGGTEDPNNDDKDSLTGSGYIAWEWKISLHLDWEDNDSFWGINVVGLV